MRKKIHESRKIAIKVGTSILSAASGKISQAQLRHLGDQISTQMNHKKEIVLVSSGAIAFGMEALGIQIRPKEMSKMQACAAIGQSRLMRAYELIFQKRKIKVAQLLLTRDGLERRKTFLNARRTLAELLKLRALPIVNENDTVSHDEIAFGDNDILSVHVAHLMQADLLVILSDVDGFFLKDGSRLREVDSIEDIDGRLIDHLKDSKKQRTVGGMRAKLEAARVAMKLGVPLLIVNGNDPKVIDKIMSGEDVGTLFHVVGHPKSARKRWIAYAAARKGSVHLDQGACDALTERKRSLLASGVTSLEGNFVKGDIVEIFSPKGVVLGRGVIRYTQKELQQIMGKKTKEIDQILGYKHCDEVIHRNDMVLWY